MFVLKHNFKEDKRRTKEDIKVLRDEYIISDKEKKLGKFGQGMSGLF